MQHFSSFEGWIAITGTVAAVCTTAAFLPQIVKIRRQGGRDLSYGMLVLYLVGVLLWLGYGLLTGAGAVIASNLAATLLVAVALFLKWRADATRPASARRLRIAVDMDETIADSLGQHLRDYNDRFGARLTRADLEGRRLEDVVPEEHRGAAAALVDRPGFFADLAVAEGSREVLRDLAARHEVIIASAAMEVPTSFADKYAWLRRHFPFIPPSHYLFCGDKGVLRADVLIDDTARHFERFEGRALLFSAPHNRRVEGYERVEGWADVRRLLLPPAAEASRPELAAPQAHQGLASS